MPTSSKYEYKKLVSVKDADYILVGTNFNKAGYEVKKITYKNLLDQLKVENKTEIVLKTLNGESLFGTGDIVITPFVPTTLAIDYGVTGTPDGTKFLRDDLTWQAVAGAGTVTSVGTGTGLTGGTITTTGTISLNSKLTPADSLTGNALKYLRVNAGETAVEYATASSSGGILHGTTSGTDTYTVTITGATAYADGDAYLIRFAIGNTTSATLNINSQGAIPLYRNNDGPLLGGDVTADGEMICVYNSTTNVFQCIGVSPNSLIAYVTNDDSVTITKGQPVYAFSGTGDRMTVKLAYNTGDSTSAQTIGLVLSTSIASNQKGLIMMQGLLDGLSSVKPVNGWVDGSPVYLGTTAGSTTPTKQYAPNHLVYLGFVTTASPGAAGRIYVRVQNGYELDELHDVQAQTPADKDTLYFDNTATPKQWKTASISTILGYTPGTVTSVVALTLGTTGTDLSSTVANGTTTPVITLQVPTASAANRGALSSADWTIFNGKQASLSGTGIVKSTGGTISYLTDNSTNWNTAFGWGNHAGLYSALGHTHLLSAGATDVTATAAALNLLDLAGLTAGWVLSADTATTASWKAPAGGGATTSSLTFSVTWYFPTNNSWNSWSATQTVDGLMNTQYGTGAVPTENWQQAGIYIPDGSKLKSLRMAGRSNANFGSVAVYVRLYNANTDGNNIDSNAELNSVEIIPSTTVASFGIGDLRTASVSLGDYVVSGNKMLLIYMKAVNNTSGATRNIPMNIHINLEN